MTIRAWSPSSDDILNLHGVRHRVDRFRFELCDRDLVPIGELHPDYDASVPSIANDTGNETSRRLSSFVLTPDEANDVNPITDRLRVYMVLQNDSEHRMGTFMWVSESRPLRSWGNESHSELTDLTYILSRQTTRAFGWERGANIALIMIFLVQRAGFAFSDIHVLGEEASRGLAEPMTWEPGATWTQMLTDLGNLVGFAAPWINSDGGIVMDEPPDPEHDDITVPSYDGYPRIIADSITPVNDIITAPNDFAAVDSGTGQQRIGRFQLPASAPHSFANRGWRAGLVESVQGTASQAQANKAARNLARTKGGAYERMTFNSTLDPRHETYDILEADGKRWLEESWSAELRSGGDMAHTVRRTTYVPN